jgi:recombination protein RecA
MAKSKDTLDLLIGKINRAAPRKGDMGTFSISKSAIEVPSRVKYVVKTGLEPLDIATGGIPFGRLTEVFGLEASGKTAVAVATCVAAQMGEIYENMPDNTLRRLGQEEYDVTCLYIDNEQSLNDSGTLFYKGQKAVLGLAECDTVEQFFKMVELAVEKLHEVEQEEKRMQFLLVVLDTIAGTSSNEEIHADWNKQDYVRQPAILRKGFRRVVRLLDKANVLMLITNQVSDSFDPKPKSFKKSFIPQAEDFRTFGGRAIKFFARLRIFMYPMNLNYNLTKGRKAPQGFSCEFKVIKNSQRPPNRKGRLVLFYDGGFSSIYSLLETFVMYDFAEGESDGSISFKFSKNGVTPTTFPDLKEGRNPVIESRAEWAAFYEAHKSDFDRLWEKLQDYIFSVSLTTTDEVHEEEEDNIIIDEDEA